MDSVDRFDFPGCCDVELFSQQLTSKDIHGPDCPLTTGHFQQKWTLKEKSCVRIMDLSTTKRRQGFCSFSALLLSLAVWMDLSSFT